MGAVTRDVKKSRNRITKTARLRLPKEKTEARRRYRSQLKASDRRNDFDGHTRPTFTKLNVT